MKLNFFFSRELLLFKVTVIAIGLFLLFFPSFNLSAQEVFDNNANGRYQDNQEVINLYDLNLNNNVSFKKDFLHPNNDAYKAQGNANAATRDRFGNAFQAMHISPNQNLILPTKIVSDITHNDKGFSVSAWLNINEFNKDCHILSFVDYSNGNKEDIQLRIKNGYFQILKSSKVAQKLVVMGQSRYKISYTNEITKDVIYPDLYDYGGGFVYFMLSSDKNSTRIYFSRPGGRLYANYFWFGLSDVLSNNQNIVFGSVDQKATNTISAIDDVMVYKEMLSPELANNHFLLQSPIYPSRSYILRNYQNMPITPQRGFYTNGTIKINEPYTNEGIYSNARWFLPVRKISGSANKFISFVNAYSLKPITRNESGSGKYFYQIDGKRNYDKQLFEPKRILGDTKNLLQVGRYNYKFLSEEYSLQNYHLGFDNYNLYLQENNRVDNNWSIQGSFSSAVRENFSQVSNLGIRLINYATKQSMALYYAQTNNYLLIQSNSTYEPFSLERKPKNYGELEFKYGYENYIFNNLVNNAGLNVKSGVDNTTNKEFIFLSGNQKAQFRLEYARDDSNGKPLYVVRLDNGYGARVLIPNRNQDGYTYVVQNEISYGDVSYNFDHLWSVNPIFFESNNNSNKAATTLKTIENEELSSFNIYPNPVRDIATIEYSLNSSAYTRIYITNFTGQIMKTLKEGTQNIGTYKETFNTRNWIPGAYLCVFETDGKIVTTKKINVQ